MIKKIMSVILVVALCLLFGFAGTYIGIRINKDKVAKENSVYEHVNSIAVVNLDEGVVLDEGKRFYAAEIINLPNDDFKLASLEEARNGIQNGTFGAYIVIPATFSETVESLNETPTKAQITYAYNPYLADENKVEVESDVDMFWRDINERLSYSYVSSIMQDYHYVQDQSAIILDNDIKDMENIDAIDPETLEAELVLSEKKVVEGDFEFLDLSESIEENSQCIENINQAYNEAQEKNTEKITELTTGLTDIASNEQALADSITDIHFLTDDNGNYILTDKMNTLNDKLCLTVDGRNTCKKELTFLSKENIYESEKGYQTYVDSQLAQIKHDEQQAFDEWYEQVKSAVPTGTVLPSKFVCMENVDIDLSLNRNAEPMTPEELLEYYNANDDEKREMEINKLILSDDLKERIDNIDFVPQDVVDYMLNEVEPEIVQKIEDGCNEYMGALDALNASATEYVTKLSTFNLLENLNTETVSNSLSALNSNIMNMQTMINENTTKQMQYVSDVTTASLENEQTFINDLKLANGKTKTNVETTVATLKSNRKLINSFNNEILSGFVDRLPYTRVGELENHQVYSYIVSPAEFSDASEPKPVVQEIKDNTEMNLMIIIIICGALALAATASMIVLALRNKVVIKE